MKSITIAFFMPLFFAVVMFAGIFMFTRLGINLSLNNLKLRHRRFTAVGSKNQTTN